MLGGLDLGHLVLEGRGEVEGELLLPHLVVVVDFSWRGLRGLDFLQERLEVGAKIGGGLGAGHQGGQQHKVLAVSFLRVKVPDANPNGPHRVA